MNPLTEYQIYVLQYLAGREFIPPTPGEDYDAALDALRRAGFVLSLGDSHYLSNSGKSTLRWIETGHRKADLALGR